MGKKKKKDKPKKKKDKSKIDERVKSINAIQPPDENPFKMDNEDKIDRFLRFGFRKKKGKGFKSLKEKNNRANKG